MPRSNILGRRTCRQRSTSVDINGGVGGSREQGYRTKVGSNINFVKKPVKNTYR